MEFHNRLAMATKNRVLYQLTTIVGSLFNRNRDLTFDINDAMAGAFEWHRRIYEKVTAGDPEGAYQAMKEHLEWTSKRIRASLKPDLIP
jgi:DNA-binding FadR family transcriptional regulator